MQDTYRFPHQDQDLQPFKRLADRRGGSDVHKASMFTIPTMVKDLRHRFIESFRVTSRQEISRPMGIDLQKDVRWASFLDGKGSSLTLFTRSFTH